MEFFSRIVRGTRFVACKEPVDGLAAFYVGPLSFRVEGAFRAGDVVEVKHLTESNVIIRLIVDKVEASPESANVLVPVSVVGLDPMATLISHETFVARLTAVVGGNRMFLVVVSVPYQSRKCHIRCPVEETGTVVELTVSHGFGGSGTKLVIVPSALAGDQKLPE